MAEPVIAAADAPHRQPPSPLPDAGAAVDAAALAGLARAGVATHAVGFAEHDGASLTDEARALEALAAVVEGQIFRLAPLRYAVRLAGDSAAGEALAAALAQALDCPAPQVTALGGAPAPANDAPADLLRAFAAPAAQPLLRVMDAGAALAAAERTAAHIAALATQPDPSLTERLDRIEAALAALAARPQPEVVAPAAVGDDAAAANLLARLEARLDRLDAMAERPAEAGMGDRLAAIEAASERLPAAVIEALAARDGEDGMRAALDWLLQAVADLRAQRVTEAGELSALLLQARALAERPVVSVDVIPEREELAQLSGALQAVLSRLDAEAARRDAAARESAGGAADDAADGAADGALDARLAGVQAALDRLAAPDASVAALAALQADIAALAARAAPDPADALAALRDDVRALAARPAPAADLRAEREGLNRILFGLQTLMARMEAEIARLSGGEDQLAPLAERLDALTDALAPLSQAADALEQAREAALRGAQSAEATIAVAQAVREECVALRGLHARWFEAGGAQRGPLDEPLVERIGATLAEFLAQLQRIETQRAAQHGLPPLRIGRGQ